MKSLLILALLSGGVPPAITHQADLTSCDLETQHEVASGPSRPSNDAAYAHITTRINILQADIGTSRKARRISANDGEALFRKTEEVRSQAAGYVKQQGFLSAGERASYDRVLDDVAMAICNG